MDTSGGKQLYLSQTLMPTQLKCRMDDASDPQGAMWPQKEPTSWEDRHRPSAKKILTTHCAEQCVCQSRHGGTIPKMSFRNKSSSNVPMERRNLPGFDRGIRGFKQEKELIRQYVKQIGGWGKLKS